MESGETKQKAEFNMAVSYLNRLNAFFYAADMACYSMDIYAWFNSLIILYRELSTEINQAERDKLDLEMMSLNNEVMRTYKLGARNGRVEMRPDTYMRLHKFEQRLRDITKEAGLQMKMTDDATNALM